MPILILLSSVTGSAQIQASQQSREMQTQTVEHPDLAQATKLIDEGKYLDAIAELKKLAEMPDHKGVAHQLGSAYYKMGDYPNAVNQLQQAAAEDPGDKEA